MDIGRKIFHNINAIESSDRARGSVWQRLKIVSACGLSPAGMTVGVGNMGFGALNPDLRGRVLGGRHQLKRPICGRTPSV
jgi:hypothetical protein